MTQATSAGWASESASATTKHSLRLGTSPIITTGTDIITEDAAKPVATTTVDDITIIATSITAIVITAGAMSQITTPAAVIPATTVAGMTATIAIKARSSLKGHEM